MIFSPVSPIRTASYLIAIVGWLWIASFIAAAQPNVQRDAKSFALQGNALDEICKFYEENPEGPYQVMIEVIIFEVFLKNSDQIGFIYDILGEVGEFWGTNLAGDPTLESDLGVLGAGNRNELEPAGANIAFNIFESDDDSRVEAVFQALAEDQVVQVYSNPRLVTLNGVAARLETGEEIPFLERKNLGTSETFTTNFRKTGITLDITPNVEFSETDVQREKPIISTTIKVNLSSISRYREEEGYTQPIVDTRNFQTIVPLRIGQRIVIASLYRDVQENFTRGVPILKDVPLFGRLFKGTTDRNEISQLFVMVRPDLFDYQGQHIQSGEDTTDPEQTSKEFRQILEDRARNIESRSSTFEEFRELFIDRDAPQ
ncbi:MAG: type II secretion system protein GspD [Candidatus Hinthialibacter sp.]